MAIHCLCIGKAEPRYDTCWRKSVRIAARIFTARRELLQRLSTARDVALGHKLAEDNGVTPRLIQLEAIYGFKGRKYQLELSRQENRLTGSRLFCLHTHHDSDITRFLGLQPLQVFFESGFLSQDIDLYAISGRKTGITWSILWPRTILARRNQNSTFKVCDPKAFRSTSDWRNRAVEVNRNGHLFRFVHPWDVLVSKLQRLEEKDLEAFKTVISKTGHPTEA